MGKYNFVKIDKLSDEQVKHCIERAKLSSSEKCYSNYSKMDFKEASQKWYDHNMKMYDYYVNVCGLDKKEFERDYLDSKLKENIESWKICQECYDKCLNGEMTLKEVITNLIKLGKDMCTDLHVIKRRWHYYILIEE